MGRKPVPDRPCSVEGCEYVGKLRSGMCGKHYQRVYFYGDPHATPKLDPPEVRVWRYVEKTETCWNWTGGIGVSGYGKFSPNIKSYMRAHRYVYELLVGPIAEGMQIDHLCKNRRCVNPAHLEVVTPRENVMRSDGLGAKNSKKTHCLHGHEFTPENTLLSPRRGTNCVGRVCRICKRRREVGRVRDDSNRVRRRRPPQSVRG